MANQPHDASGRKCGVCKKIFEKTNLTRTIKRKSKGSIEHVRVCVKCHDDYYSKGE